MMTPTILNSLDLDRLNRTPQSLRIETLKQKMLDEPRFMSIEQARIITAVYQANPDQPVIMKRALALRAALEQLEKIGRAHV